MKGIKAFSVYVYLNTIQKISLFLIIAILAFAFPLFIVIQAIVIGNIPFWYDPARDLLLGVNNLSKLTLIGPTSGIPGIFYGPYWIWLLSGALFFSKDPRFVTFFIEAIPYFTILPLILYKFSTVFTKRIALLMWLLFMLDSGINYAVQLWSPHLAPLITLVVIYMIIFTDYSKRTRFNYLRVFFTGILLGLVVNFHISFGLGLFLGVFIYLFIDSVNSIIKNSRNLKFLLIDRATIITVCFLGVLCAFFPFFLFEYRHGFHQLQTTLQTLIVPWAVVGQKGLDKSFIIRLFFEKQIDILHMPKFFIYPFYVLLFAYTIIQIRLRRISFNDVQKKLILLLCVISGSVLFLYLTSKNPVWEYHFIGVEILFLLFTGLLVYTFPILEKTLIIWVIILIVLRSVSFVQDLQKDPYSIPSFATKKYIVEKIMKDAGNTDYTVFAYSPSIYAYEYSYLFKWRDDKDISYDPANIKTDSNVVYLILSNVNSAIGEDFIHYRASGKKYKTTYIWKIPDGTKIIKRETK